MNFPWLLIILLIPLIASVLLFIPKKYVIFKDQQIALYSSLITLLFVIVVALQFDTSSNAATQFDISFDWIPVFGISFHLGLTGISLVLIALTAVLTPVVILATEHVLVLCRFRGNAYSNIFLSGKIWWPPKERSCT
jgi:NADH-quinone oxidoreductase subunit M